MSGLLLQVTWFLYNHSESLDYTGGSKSGFFPWCWTSLGFIFVTDSGSYIGKSAWTRFCWLHLVVSSSSQWSAAHHSGMKISTSSSKTMVVTKEGRGWCPKWSILGSCSRVRGGVDWEIDRQADVVHGGEERSQHKSEAVDLLVYLYPCGHELWLRSILNS